MGMDLREDGLLFEDSPPLLLLDFTLGNRFAQQFRQLFDLGHQRLYRFSARDSFLGQP